MNAPQNKPVESIKRGELYFYYSFGSLIMPVLVQFHHQKARRIMA